MELIKDAQLKSAPSLTTHFLLHNSGEELQHTTAHKAIDITCVRLQGVQELIPCVFGSFFQLLSIQHLQQHLCHSSQNGIAHPIALQDNNMVEKGISPGAFKISQTRGRGGKRPKETSNTKQVELHHLCSTCRPDARDSSSSVPA